MGTVRIRGLGDTHSGIFVVQLMTLATPVPRVTAIFTNRTQSGMHRLRHAELDPTSLRLMSVTATIEHQVRGATFDGRNRTVEPDTKGFVMFDEGMLHDLLSSRATSKILGHVMHHESYSIPPSTRAAIAACSAAGGRVVG